MSKTEEHKTTVQEEILSWIKTIVAAVVIAFLLSNFVIASVQVPTGSMLNTIQLDDRIIGNRLSYKFSEPERGDVVIFYAPDETDGTLYIKRLIGLPGDTIVLEDGKVYINGSDTPLEEDYLPEEWVEGTDGYYEIPEDCYFFMGDNRNNSLDARYWDNTYVHKDAIVAKASFIYFPFRDAKFL